MFGVVVVGVVACNAFRFPDMCSSTNNRKTTPVTAISIFHAIVVRVDRAPLKRVVVDTSVTLAEDPGAAAVMQVGGAQAMRAGPRRVPELATRLSGMTSGDQRSLADRHDRRRVTAGAVLIFLRCSAWSC